MKNDTKNEINYAAQLDTFIFRRAWGDILKDFSDEDVGAIIKAVFAYMDGKETFFSEKTTRTVYRIITGQLNYSARKYLYKNNRLDESVDHWREAGPGSHTSVQIQKNMEVYEDDKQRNETEIQSAV